MANAEVGILITCPECNAELEVISTNPLDVYFRFDEEWDEDWSEEQDGDWGNYDDYDRN